MSQARLWCREGYVEGSGYGIGEIGVGGEGGRGNSCGQF